MTSTPGGLSLSASAVDNAVSYAERRRAERQQEKQAATAALLAAAAEH